MKYSSNTNYSHVSIQSLIQPESDFSTLSLHEPTPEEKEKAEKLKNEGINKRVLKHTASKGVGYSGLFYGCKILYFKGKKVFSFIPQLSFWQFQNCIYKYLLFYRGEHYQNKPKLTPV